MEGLTPLERAVRGVVHIWVEVVEVVQAQLVRAREAPLSVVAWAVRQTILAHRTQRAAHSQAEAVGRSITTALAVTLERAVRGR